MVYTTYVTHEYLIFIFRYSLGDVNTPFTIQSVSKPLTYGLVLDDLTPDVVHQYVGHEPSGVAFNSIGLNYKGNRDFFWGGGTILGLSGWEN